MEKYNKIYIYYRSVIFIISSTRKFPLFENQSVVIRPKKYSLHHNLSLFLIFVFHSSWRSVPATSLWFCRNAQKRSHCDISLSGLQSRDVGINTGISWASCWLAFPFFYQPDSTKTSCVLLFLPEVLQKSQVLRSNSCFI